jgi:hypothetical protein
MKVSRYFWANFIVTLVALAIIAGSASAQTIYGSIRGLVTDPSSAIVANGKVTLTNEGTALERTATTNTSGEYAFSQVLPGTYTVTVETMGFKKVERKGVILETQNQITVDLQLEVGNVAESISVTTEVPLIETATASQGQVIDNQKLIDLPNIGRNPFMMSKLTPTIQMVGNPAYMRMQDQSGSSQISFAGGPIRGNNYMLDGVSITDMNNRAIVIASLESVQEMKVQTNTYDAEMGRTGGGVFNVTMRSGSNEFHGSGGGWLRNTDWEANAFFNNAQGIPRTDQPNRTYYGSFGGPVWIPKVYNGKNRTFFWGSLEGYRDTQGNSGQTAVPTAAERVGDFTHSFDGSGNLVIQYDPLLPRDANGNRTPFSGNIIPASRIDKTGLAIASYFGAPTRTAPFGAINVGYSGVLPSKAGQGTIKVDHRITNWWNANVSFLRYHSNEPGENWFPGNPATPEQWLLDRRVDATQVNNTLTVNPTTVVTVRYGFNRFPNFSYTRSQGFNITTLGFPASLASQLTHPNFPIVNYQNYYPGDQMDSQGNNGSYVPYSRTFGAAVSKFIGKHSLKMGVDWRSISDDGIDFDGSRGDLAFDFNDQFTRKNAAVSGGGGSDIASLLLGYPAVATGFQSTKLFENVRYEGVYVQDDIRVNARLTVNVGLRWEHETGLSDRNGNLIVGFDPNATNSLGAKLGIPVKGSVEFQSKNGYPSATGNYTYNKMSPRFGLAYSLDQKTIIRGGWGIFWAPSLSFSGPYTPEGATATTTPNPSSDGFNTPLIQLSNPFPNGLVKPVGTGNGDATCLGISCNIFDRNSKGTYIDQFSFDIQRELPFAIAVSGGYVGSRTYRLMLGTPNININQLDPKYFSMGTAALGASVTNPYYVAGGPGIIGSAKVTQAQLLRPYPAFGDINIQYSDQNKAQFDSLVLKAQKRLSQGLTFLAAYTYSKNFDRSSGGTGSDINRGSKNSPQNVYNLPAEWAPSIVDATHRLSLTSSYELPFGRNKQFLGNANRAVDYVVGGWQVNAVNVDTSGYPVIITQNSNNNGAYFAGGMQRPNATGTSAAASGDFSARLNQWLNPTAFSTAPALTYGNVARTIPVKGPGMANWDISIFKNFVIYERFRAQFRAEALNAFNTPYFRSPNGAFGSGSFGQVNTQGNFPRFIDLALRLSF